MRYYFAYHPAQISAAGTVEVLSAIDDTSACPGDTSFDTAGQAMLAGQQAAGLAFAFFNRRRPVSAMLLRVHDQQEDNNKVLERIVHRGQLFCPRCGEELGGSAAVVSSAGDKHSRQVLMYDRLAGSLVAAQVQPVCYVKCPRCSVESSADAVSTGVDMLGSRLGSRYISIRGET